MFTIEQIKAAHSKVKSGSDFPAYIKELKKLGVVYYETFVADGHADYYGTGNYKSTSPPKYKVMKVVDKCNKEQFINDLKAHQQGKSDYPTFIKQSADSGIEKWIVRMDEMKCSYYDRASNEVLVEVIPDVD